jgi:photosystem II stability/assembly factor-like uncharacterized protein
MREWQPVGVDEYGYVAPDPRNPALVFGGRNVTRFDYRSGQTSTVGPRSGRADAPAPFRQVRTHPVVFSEADKRTLLFGNNFLWKTTDGGITWRRISGDLTRRAHDAPPSIGTYTSRAQAQLDTNGARVIYTIGPSPIDVNRIWIGTDDGVIQTTADGGLHWTHVTPPTVQSYWKVFMIDAGRFDTRTAYAAVNTLRVSDMRPHIYRTHDAGRTWKEIVAGMEDGGPVNAVREDPKKRGLLYASTEKGVYVSFDDGEHWQSLRLNLPASSIRDLIVKNDDLAVATHGRGFWILDDIARLRQMGPSTSTENVVLFKPADAWRVRWNLSTDMPWPKDEPTLPNPPEGTAIDYYLKSASSAPITLEVVTATGRVVRRYSSADKPAPVPELSAAPVPLYWYRPPQHLAATAGMHRFHWDLRYQPLAEGGGGRGGLAIQAVPFNSTPAPTTPLVAPGTYTVKLTVDDRSYTQPLTVKQDPRVATPAVHLNQLYSLVRSSYADAVDARAALDSAQRLRREVEGRRSSAPDAVRSALDAFDKRLETLIGAPAPGGGRGRGGSPAQSPDTLAAVVAALSGLARELGAADVQPTAEQVKAVADARAAARRMIGRWQSLSTTELEAVNAALTKAGLEPIK